jgi:HEAT repeat protein
VTATDGLVALLTHSRAQTQFDAAYALAALGDSRGLAVLLRHLDDKALGWPAIEAVQSLGDRSAVPALADLLRRHLTIPRLLKVRAAGAVLALAPDGGDAPRARRELVTGLHSLRLESRAVAAQCLGDVGGRWAIDPLRAARASFWGRPIRDELDHALAQVETRLQHGDVS